MHCASAAPHLEVAEADAVEACRILARWQARHAPGKPPTGPPTLPIPLRDGPLPGGLFAWQCRLYTFGRAYRGGSGPLAASNTPALLLILLLRRRRRPARPDRPSSAALA